MNYFEFIIPAIDIIDGKCVRLSKGDYNHKTVYNDDPVAVATEFAAAGYQRLHLVDLDGAKKGSVVNWKVLEAIAANTNLSIDFSGGIGSLAEAKQVLALGADYIAVGSIAVKKPNEFRRWIDEIGAAKFILGIDVRNEQVAIKGWTETTEKTIYDMLNEYTILGLHHVFCTDISKDGLLAGPSLELYKKILSLYPKLQLIASGGVSSIQDVVALKEIGCAAAIVGKAFYEGHIDIQNPTNVC